MSEELPELSGPIKPLPPTSAGDEADPTASRAGDDHGAGLSGAPAGGADRPATGSVAGPRPSDPPRCGRWKLKPFELPRPVLLRPDGPLTLAEFLARPDPAVLDAFSRLELDEVQALVLARLRGAPPEMRLSLFGEPGYTMGEVVRHVEEGTPLGVRIIDAERKLVGLLLTEALRDAP